MTPERQKGRCYYRCQRKGCPTATIREDRLDEAILCRLRKLQIDPDLARQLEERWTRESTDKQTTEQAAAARLQIHDEQSRLERLTDLLVDGALDTATYQKRQRASRLRLAELQEQIAELPDQDEVERNRRDFLELMKSLCLLYEMAKPLEKREIVENAFSNRAVAGRYVELEPSDWLKVHETTADVFECDPERYRDTDLPGVPAGVKSLDRLLNLFSRRQPSGDSHPP